MSDETTVEVTTETVTVETPTTPSVVVTTEVAPDATTTTTVVVTPPSAVPPPPTEADHEQAVGYSNQVEFYPPHPPRSETAEYNATHHLLVNVLDQPCRFCGVRKSTLGDPTQNPFGATDIETHHFPIQRELADACDWRKVARDYPKEVVDQASFLKFVDSPANMWLCCAPCHRGPNGLHHDVVNNTAIRKYLLDGYVLTGKGADAAAILARDQAIVDAAVPIDERI